MDARRSLPAIFLAMTLGLSPRTGSAQDATPEAAQRQEFDLAAMALAPDDVPPGYLDDYGEIGVPGALVPDLVLWGEAAPPGLERTYQSFYFNPDEAAAVHAFLFEFATPEEAAAGIAVVDAALRPPLPEGTVIGPIHAPGPALGDEPRTTVVTYDTWAAGGPRVDIVAVSFRRDRLVAGVAVERYTDPPAAGTPMAGAATPMVADPAQQELATRLATVLDERITAVLAGRAPAGVDLVLADIALPLDQLADVPTPVLGGYKSGIDLLRCGICGEENALLPFADDARGGYAQTISLGPLVDGEPQPPWVQLAVSVFATPQAAQDVLAAIRNAPNDRPTPGPVPRGERTLVDDPTIPGADAALAFHATLDPEDPTATADSAGVDFVVGDRLVTVDVQGGLPADEALEAAIDLATQQAACLAADGPCAAVTLPPSLAEAVATE